MEEKHSAGMNSCFDIGPAKYALVWPRNASHEDFNADLCPAKSLHKENLFIFLQE